MHAKIISFILGRLLIFLSGIMFIPWLMSFYYCDDGRAVFLDIIFYSMICGWLLMKAGRLEKNIDEISSRDGIFTVVAAWVLSAFVAGMPYWLGGMLDPVSSFFEGMSGLTTTGATAMSVIEGKAPSILFWRFMTHWLGGLGIIVIFIAVLPGLSGGAAHLFNAEVSGFSDDKLKPKLKNTAMTLFSIYTFITLATALALYVAGLNVYDSLGHAMSAVATGGFSNYNDSVAHFHSSVVELILGLSMIVSGANFALYYHTLEKGPGLLWKDEEFSSYIKILLAIVALCTVDLAVESGAPFLHALRDSFFNVVSFASTTGFVSADFDVWPVPAKLGLVLLYFTGACAGSTAGGIKVSRFVVLTKSLKTDLLQLIHPKKVKQIKFNGKKLGKSIVYPIVAFFCMYILTTVVLSIFLAATGVPILESLSGVAACISSVGPGFGLVGATGNYSGISAAGKLILCFAMLLGRLEIFTVLVLFRKDFYKKGF